MAEILLQAALEQHSQQESLQRLVPFHFLPQQLQRRSQLDEGNNRVSETIQLELLLHAYGSGELPASEQPFVGIHPQLSALEELFAAQARPSGSNVPAWLRGTIPWVFLSFNWGTRKIPVRISQMNITEHLFDAQLNPVHATVDLRLRVLRREEVLSVPEARMLFDKYRELRRGAADQWGG